MSALLAIAGLLWLAQPAVTITTANNTPRELRARQLVEDVLSAHDLRRYTFTREVVIQEGAINHSFPVLTLNAGFATVDDVLSTYVHEQIHWHLRERGDDQRQAIAALRRVYPRVPGAAQGGAESEIGTYGHLITCFLEIAADRRLIGEERTAAVISRKRNYEWIYKTVLADEARIAAIVRRYDLEIR